MDWNGKWETVKDYRAYFGEYKVSRGAEEQGSQGESGTVKQSDSKTAGQLDSVSFTFRGTDLDLVALQNPYGGAIRVQIDNASPREIELWRTDAGVGGRIALARDLDNGAHRATITVTRAPVAINGFVVQRGNAWLVKKVGFVGLLVGLVGGMFVIGRRRARMNAD
jgi:hypothetical protein